MGLAFSQILVDNIVEEQERQKKIRNELRKKNKYKKVDTKHKIQ